MKINFQSVKQLAILGVASLVISCGGGDGAVPTPPPVVPKAKITGVVMIGPVTNAELRIYGFDKNNEVIPKPLYEQVGTGTTDLAGGYSFEVQESAEKTPMLICAEAGTYTEPAAPPNSKNPTKDFKNGNKLCAAFVYKKGEDQFVSITHFTHLATGLLKYKLLNGGKLLDTIESVPNADPKKDPTISLTKGSINDSNSRVGAWLGGFDIISTKPVDFLNTDYTTSSLTGKPDYKYGLAIIGISSIVDWLSTSGKIEGDFVNVSSISFAQKVYEDIKLDGVLGGRGEGQFANHKLNLHINRHHYALRLMSVIANSDINHTTLDLQDVKAYVESIALFNGKLFASIPKPEPLNLNKPAITHESSSLEGLKKIITKDAVLSFSILDATGIDVSRTTLTLIADPSGVTSGYADQLPEAQVGNDISIFKWKINVTNSNLLDGLYKAKLIAYNNLGEFSTKTVTGFKVLNGEIGITQMIPVGATAQNPDGAISKSASGIQNFIVKVTDAFRGAPPVAPSKPPQLIKFELLKKTGTAVSGVSLTPVNPDGVNVAGTTTDLIFETSYDLNTSVDGQYILRTTANSAVQTSPIDTTLQATLDFPFAIDTFAPTVGLTSPAAGSAFPTLPNLLVSLVDPGKGPDNYFSGIDKVKVFLDNNEVSPGSFNGSQGINQPLTGIIQNDGAYSMRVEATDKAGNLTRSATNNFLYDSTPPTITPDRTKEGKWWRLLPIVATAKDNLGLVKFNYQGNGVNLVELISAPNTPTSYTILDANQKPLNLKVPAKLYQVSYSAEDRAGNKVGPINTLNIGVDTQAPKISAAVTTTITLTTQTLGTTTGLVDTTKAFSANYALDSTVSEPGWAVTGGTQSGIDVNSVTLFGKQPASIVGNAGAYTFPASSSAIATALDLKPFYPVMDIVADWTVTKDFDVAVSCPGTTILVANTAAGVTTFKCAVLLTNPSATSTCPVIGAAVTPATDYSQCTFSSLIYAYTPTATSTPASNPSTAVYTKGVDRPTNSFVKSKTVTPSPKFTISVSDKTQNPYNTTRDVCVKIVLTNNDSATAMGYSTYRSVGAKIISNYALLRSYASTAPNYRTYTPEINYVEGRAKVYPTNNPNILDTTLCAAPIKAPSCVQTGTVAGVYTKCTLTAGKVSQAFLCKGVKSNPVIANATYPTITEPLQQITATTTIVAPNTACP